MQYLIFEGIPDREHILKGILDLHDLIFNTELPLDELKQKKGVLVMAAVDHDTVVGYKIGYERKKKHYYSWLGGVDPRYQRQGIATELMRRQHQWCQEKGYLTVRTHTKNKWRGMLILNLRHGFDVIGTYTDDRGEPKIILEKKLAHQ
ncbi:GCN5-related N-acetyltransferase [Caldalkalibacillus thermarum TA2.A1]|uniref:GCN5-related N-acetyltransferase n=1 Tax=Caldalkalibacillus thermarum (strain TA2.A1) TaxID=986075 RepID=F5L5K5_CALTT|nr:GNAT family N-acetyltransferase [Caldalkalibacillus thermarum]EGL83361.1 GCN5-related N-acetyltransferase [Caldalkalibacillus thermarum TA2.A1]QZT32876.1 GNAT family N-acetyltransferase [Caldalkalibacillus thermarum TA2.A1]